MSKELKAPFPWFGGKSRAAHLIWERFGDVSNYIEPFAGSLAVLLSRPTPPKIETVNDLDCYLSNFWRAVQAAPEEVAKWADWPVNEADLHARRIWMTSQEEFRKRMTQDPHHYDSKLAGWWAWGVSAAIAGNFCALNPAKSPVGSGPNLKGTGTGTNRIGFKSEMLLDLQSRLRRVRVYCGNWSRVLTDTPLYVRPCAVLLDPPYSDGVFNYATDISKEVAAWAIERGNDPTLRIALCGHEGEHEMPESWSVVEWHNKGGYGNQRKDKSNLNKFRERIWFSPGCLRATQGRLL